MSSSHSWSLVKSLAAAVLVSVAGVAVSGGCGAEAEPLRLDVATADAAAGPLAATDVDVFARVERVRAQSPALTTALAPRAVGLGRSARGFGSHAWRATRPEASHLGALFPVKADEPLRFSPARVDEWSLRLHPIGAQPVEGRADQGRVLWADAYRDTDLIASGHERSAEWFLVLKSPDSPTAFSWGVELGSDLRVREERLADGSIDLLDFRGDPALRINPAWAVDARGEKRDVELTLHDGELRVAVDTTGLVFPVVVDPLISVPIWLQIPSGGWQARSGHSLAYLPSGVVMVGGEFGYNTYTNQAWRRTGTTWTDIVDPAWPGFAGAPAVNWGNTLVLFGGCNGPSCSNTTGLGLGLRFDGTSWGAFCGFGGLPACGPAARTAHSMAAANGQLLMVGGRTNAAVSPYAPTYLEDPAAPGRAEVWVLESTDNPVVFVRPTPSTDGPQRRTDAAMAGDEADGLILLVGGYNSTDGALADTWIWRKTGAHAGAWECVCGCYASNQPKVCQTSPVARQNAGLVFDSARKKFILFGGFLDIGSGQASGDDMWEFDPLTKKWNLLCGGMYGNSCGLGLQNDGPGLVFDASRGRVVQIAGYSLGYRDWCYEAYVRGDSCTCGGGVQSCTSTSCDRAGGGTLPGNSGGFCANGACCEVLDCGTCKSCADPANDGNPGICRNIPQNQADAAHACAACDGNGTCKLALGTACTAGTQCASASCVNSVCCSTASCGVGLTCAPSGTCKKQPGQTCGSGVECASGNCVDGTCCTTASCSAGQKCSFASANGVCKKNDGQSCAAGSECGNTNCIESFCCGTACGSACDTCSASGAQGTCIPISAGGTPQSPGCGNYLCSGSAVACPSACTSDAQCAASAYCRTSDGTCQPDQGNGGACATGAQCTSTFCADGVCCNSACGGACQACSAGKTGGANGTCADVTVGSDPDSECTQDPATSCQRDGACNGAGACRLYASGTSCLAASCTSGVAQSGTCNGTGTCNAAPTPCGAYACNGTACGTTCSADGQCATGYYCATGGTCQAKKAGAAACTLGNQCVSGSCVDGVCCDTACNQPCRACSAAKKGQGADGVCDFVKVDQDPDGDCISSGTACGNTGNCDGAGTCKIPPNGTVCGATTCSGFVQIGQQCDGAGLCVSGSQSNCATGYVCLNASVCATSCTDDNQCSGGYWCNAGACVAALDSNDHACNRTRQCATGNCVDGFCCDAACNGLCEACSATKTGSTNGACAPVTDATDPENECAATAQAGCQENGSCDGARACKKWPYGTSCGSSICANAIQTGQACDGSGTCVSATSVPCAAGYVCATASACATTCASDTQCASNYYCQTSDGTCQPKVAQGQACTLGNQCPSGNCVDGVCCDLVCAGACKACSAAKKGGGLDGECGAVVAGDDPDADCSPTDPLLCGDDGACDGAGACRKHVSGTSCGVNVCGTGSASSQLTGKQCDGFGVCTAGAVTSCDPYVCAGATSCPTNCTSDAQCIVGYWCAAGATFSTCAPKVALGTQCTGAAQCQSGFCVEGVCCDSACDGTCQACTAAHNVNAQDGVCGNAANGDDPHNDCTAAPAADCDNDGTCDGNGQCRLYPAGASCGVTACQGNVQTGYACDGTGTCNPNATTDCGLFACSGSACNTTCAVDGDCAADAYCSAAACVPRAVDGEPCTSSNTCTSGVCADGLCCNRACDGQCEACDLATAKGTCSPVIGKPHGARPTCAAAPGTTPEELCQARACDGTRDVTQCVGYAGPDVACRGQACADGTETFSAACDGTGACGESEGGVKIKKCAPFVCADDKVCRDTCAVDTDCAAGNRCDSTSGQCVSATTCDGQHTITNANGETTDCAPFICSADGSCKDRCTETTDCISGYVCNGDRVCVQPQAAAASADSGCGCRTQSSGGGRGTAALGISLLVLAFARRRRGSSVKPGRRRAAEARRARCGP